MATAKTPEFRMHLSLDVTEWSWLQGLLLAAETDPDTPAGPMPDMPRRCREAIAFAEPRPVRVDG